MFTFRKSKKDARFFYKFCINLKKLFLNNLNKLKKSLFKFPIRYLEKSFLQKMSFLVIYGSIKVEVIKYIAKLHYFIIKSIFSINYSKSYKISHKMF